MLDLYEIQPFKPILMVSERSVNGEGIANDTAEDVHATARELVAAAMARGMAVSDCIIDPAISPIGADSQGDLQRLMASMRMIHTDPALDGVHMSVGLSNFSVMLPPKRADGSPTKSALESAFLTLATPLGLDHVIGSVKRNYRILPPDDPALVCIQDCLELDGFDVIIRVQEFYS
ncbi:MAG: dihydropteroate synthase [Verrucomicrobia bacterium]|nr:dihydropteroate synthase [Verrucomicrobiota bacterium]